MFRFLSRYLTLSLVGVCRHVDRDRCGSASIPLIVRVVKGSLKESKKKVAAVFFLFGSFSFFKIACGNVEILEAINRRAGLRIISPTTRWLRGDFRIWPELEAQRMLRCCPSRTRL